MSIVIVTLIMTLENTIVSLQNLILLIAHKENKLCYQRECYCGLIRRKLLCSKSPNIFV